MIEKEPDAEIEQIEERIDFKEFQTSVKSELDGLPDDLKQELDVVIGWIDSSFESTPEGPSRCGIHALNKFRDIKVDLIFKYPQYIKEINSLRDTFASHYGSMIN